MTVRKSNITSSMIHVLHIVINVKMSLALSLGLGVHSAKAGSYYPISLLGCIFLSRSRSIWTDSTGSISRLKYDENQGEM